MSLPLRLRFNLGERDMVSNGGVEEDDKIYYLLRHFFPFLEEEKMAKHAVKNEDIMQERLIL